MTPLEFPSQGNRSPAILAEVSKSRARQGWSVKRGGAPELNVTAHKSNQCANAFPTIIAITQPSALFTTPSPTHQPFSPPQLPPPLHPSAFPTIIPNILLGTRSAGVDKMNSSKSNTHVLEKLDFSCI